MTTLILKRASSSRPSGEWNEDDFDVMADGVGVGRIFKANVSPVGASWMWTLDFWHHEGRSLRHQARRPALAKMRPGSPAPATGLGTGLMSDSTRVIPAEFGKALLPNVPETIAEVASIRIKIESTTSISQIL
jgi:hypothetical protein